MKKHDVKYDWDDCQDVSGHKFIFPKDVSDDIKQEIIGSDCKISWMSIQQECQYDYNE